MINKLALLAILFTSCGELNGMYLSSDDQENYSHWLEVSGLQDLLPDFRPSGIDPEFLPYVTTFENRWGDTIKDLPINFADTGSATGICRINYDGRREVRINKNLWDQRQGQVDWLTTVVFHELGHCVLGRGHRAAMRDFSAGNIKASYPASIMFPTTRYMPLTSNYDYYMGELFR